jgi:hypothetical protein
MDEAIDGGDGHSGVVGRILAQAGPPPPGLPPRRLRTDHYPAFIRQTLASFPALTASRLYVMVGERDHRGSPDHFRHLIACIGRVRSLSMRRRGSIGEFFGHSRVGRRHLQVRTRPSHAAARRRPPTLLKD